MRKLGILFIMVGVISMLMSCNNENDNFTKMTFSITSNDYDYYESLETVDFIVFDSSNELITYFESERFMVSDEFNAEVEEHEANNFFDTKSIICMISAIGTGDQISRKKVTEDNSLTILYQVSRGEEEAIFIHFDFISIDKSYLANFSSINYEIKVV